MVKKPTRRQSGGSWETHALGGLVLLIDGSDGASCDTRARYDVWWRVARALEWRRGRRNEDEEEAAERSLFQNSLLFRLGDSNYERNLVCISCHDK